MAHRIERQPPCANGCIVSQPVTDKRMGSLMKRDGDQHNKSPQQIECNLIRRKQAVQRKHHPMERITLLYRTKWRKTSPVPPVGEGFCPEFSQKDDFTKKLQLFCAKGLHFREIFAIIVKLLKRRCKQLWPNVLAVARVSRSVSRFPILIVGATVPGIPMSSA